MIIYTDQSYDNPNLRLPDSANIEKSVAWESPSNIALIKYWGKHGKQMPMNPSLSFSLKNAFSRTTVEYKTSQEKGLVFEFFFDGVKETAFRFKLETFFENIRPIFPFLDQLELKINSTNTFPHSSGIASSASGLSALALCLCSIERNEFGHLKHPDDFFRKASYVARLGSGSAARSVFGGFVNWGRVEWEGGSSDHFADPFSLPVHEVYNDFQDTIILVSQEKKEVSSTMGHIAMIDHPYAQARYAQARSNYLMLTKALETGNLMQFAEVVEHEALSLHALMMSSKPGYFLMKPETLKPIQKIKDFRLDTNIPVCFTLDAGPNIHVLYPASAKKEVTDFLKNEIICKNKNLLLLNDEVGNGPKEILK
ncbi:MAG: diphosphomevalonate decarboxylase [Bacteroidales bacterium]|nr:diphosphomevalonate decarboxylase [Bacteroidales bacterium]MCF8457728.1 diphosphomevalonate decarboxylase [Bacteroidales bacterium]